MSDQSGGEGWWLASDGKWYPPQPQPAVGYPPPPGQYPPAPPVAAPVDRRQGRAAAKAAEREQRAAAAAQAAWLDSPVGKAQAAYDADAGFFQIQLELSEVARTAWSSSYQGYSVRKKPKPGHADTLSEIEGVGWRLEHAGYVYVMTGQISRDKFLSSGQETGVMGKVEGVYLFRRDETRRVLDSTVDEERGSG
jgi:hypothetical protein